MGTSANSLTQRRRLELLTWARILYGTVFRLLVKMLRNRTSLVTTMVRMQGLRHRVGSGLWRSGVHMLRPERTASSQAMKEWSALFETSQRASGATSMISSAIQRTQLA